MTGGPDGIMREAGVVIDDEGRIVEIAPIGAVTSPVDLRRDHQVVMPGVVNCHVHLTDAGVEEPVPGGEGLAAWVRRLQARRDTPFDRPLEQAVADVLETMRRHGTVAIGEVCNGLGTLAPIISSGMRCRFIHELIGFSPARAEGKVAQVLRPDAIAQLPDHLSYTLGAHAPYSVGFALMGLIRSYDLAAGTRLYEHLAEDPDERLLYESASGPWRGFLETVGAWDENWIAPGCSPIEQYDRMGLLDENFVAVHLADATGEEIDLLAARGVRAILSPASNLHITGKLPDVERMISSGLRFGFGTDGRGSNPSLDVFTEAAILMENRPDLPPGAMLRALTVDGAEILQFNDLGALTPGTRPGLISIEVDGTDDDPARLERSIIVEARSRRIVE